MRRRVVYVIGSPLGLALMLGTFLYLNQDEECDPGARGLVAYSEQSRRDVILEAPPEDAELPPCRVKMLPARPG